MSPPARAHSKRFVMSDSDYKIGNKRPPRHTRFQPGQSGNPKGRPKQKKSLAMHLKETLFRPVTIKENGRRRKVPYMKAFVNSVAHRAVNGDPTARRDLLVLLHRYPETVKHQQPLRTINPNMSPQEAAEIYAEALKAIPGLADTSEEWLGPCDEL